MAVEVIAVAAVVMVEVAGVVAVAVVALSSRMISGGLSVQRSDIYKHTSCNSFWSFFFAASFFLFLHLCARANTGEDSKAIRCLTVDILKYKVQYKVQYKDQYMLNNK